MPDAIFLFPGQSSRHPEMLAQAIDLDDEIAQSVLGSASSILGRDLVAWYRPENPRLFSAQVDAQVGVFLTNHIYLLLLQKHSIEGVASLGFSLGEYNHLVHIGALSFEEALRLVEARGRAYDAGPDGMMATVLGLSRDMLTPILERASATGHIEVGIHCAPSSHILSGERVAVETALALLEAERRIIGQITEQRAMHSACFQPVAAALRGSLEEIQWRPPRSAYFSTVAAQLISPATPRRMIEALAQHVYRPVLWSASLEAVLRTNPKASLIEVGPGGQLSSSLRGWVRARCYTAAEKDPREALLQTFGAKRHSPKSSS